ncbi:MAG: hypothetical protein AB1449_14245 [Chloroflexota bacterium]
MTRLWIVNADDYARTPGVSAGIRRAHLEGIITTPDIADRLLLAGSGFASQREAELAALTSPEAREAVERAGIVLATYRPARPAATWPP